VSNCIIIIVFVIVIVVIVIIKGMNFVTYVGVVQQLRRIEEDCGKFTE